MPNFQTSDGLTLYFRTEGEGIPMLCLSGLTRNSSDFNYITGKLPGARLIMMDYRGRGRSDWAADHRSYNLQRESQDALELLDHLGIARAAVLGTSRGGLNALAMAHTARQRLLGVAFNDIGPELEPRGLQPILDYLGRPPTWKTLAEAAAARPSIMGGFANVVAARWREEAEQAYHQVPGGLVLAYDPRLREAVLGSMEPAAHAAPDLWALYRGLQAMPVAVIRGANSDLLSAEVHQRMAQELSDVIVATVADRGHAPFLDEVDSLSALRRWVGRLQ
ncbi:MAG: alpha/beta hydrolase [Rhodobacteraceae bacterium]|nr:alpha/beta hydrolase [Paracoccaceae bacterium]